VRNIVRDPDRFGIRLLDIANQPFFQQVNLPYPIEAKTAARLAGMSMDDLLNLNPGFRRQVIHAHSQDNLLLPLDKLDAFRANFDAEEAQRIRLRSYSASKGELLSAIADRFDVSLQWLQDHNPLETKRGKITQAQTVMLPPASGRVALAQPAAKTDTKSTAKVDSAPATKRQSTRASVRTHTIRRGDTLYSLAKRYKVTVADIRQHNRRLDVLKPGIKLQIPLNS
jgi:membrane-bound lytic murein transglycosylase D